MWISIKDGLIRTSCFAPAWSGPQSTYIHRVQSSVWRLQNSEPILCNSCGGTFAAYVPALLTVCTTFPKLAHNISIQWPHTWLTTIYKRSWAALRSWDPPPSDRSNMFSNPCSELPNYWPPPTHPLSTQRLCLPPAPKAGGGGTHSPVGEGVGGQYFGRRQTLDWSLTV